MADESQSNSGKNSKLILIISGANIIGTLGVIIALVMAFQKEKSRLTVDDIVAGRLKEGGHSSRNAGEKSAHDPHAKKGEEDKGALADVGKVIPLDQFTINLATSVGATPRFIKMNSSIELDQGNTEDEIKAKLARVRDTIINLVNAKKASDISVHEGREVLKDEIKRALNAFLQQSKVKNVYFSNFQISN